ncbi:MAG: NAD-dependent epimerase/dehydratase family protein [Candidatus Bathyarchaeia archaeon]
MSDRVIITGAAGLVGQNLVQFLTKNDYSVLAIDKNNRNFCRH